MKEKKSFNIRWYLYWSGLTASRIFFAWYPAFYCTHISFPIFFHLRWICLRNRINVFTRIENCPQPSTLYPIPFTKLFVQNDPMAFLVAWNVCPLLVWSCSYFMHFCRAFIALWHLLWGVFFSKLVKACVLYVQEKGILKLTYWC